MKTYQDFLEAVEKNKLIDFITGAISEYRSSTEYKTAIDADEYEAERNITINEFMRLMYTQTGQQIVDFTAANNRIASNFFHRLVTQRVAYSLGNGISFSSSQNEMVNGTWVTVDKTKEMLGKGFDTVLYSAGRFARMHRVSYLFWNKDHADLFKATEFLPLFDEDDGTLKAGFRFWSLDWSSRPVTVVVYEPDGYTKYRTRNGSKGLDIVLYEPKRAYKQEIAHNEVDPDEIVGESNYSDLPIIPLWGNANHQSDLVGMRSKIDAFDLVKSGFADTVQDCAEIYWIIGNAMGMSDTDLARFRDKMKMNHIVTADVDNSSVTPYTQEIPVAARESLLKLLREQIYEDYGGLDVHQVSADSTNDHLEAAYQPMDEEADDFEYQIILAVDGILRILGVEDVPIFQRNRVTNQKERTEMIMLAANYLDDETIIKKLPFITPDEVESILSKKTANDQDFVEVEQEA